MITEGDQVLLLDRKVIPTECDRNTERIVVRGPIIAWEDDIPIAIQPRKVYYLYKKVS